MLILSKFEKILIEFDKSESESVYDEYVTKKGYKIDDEWETKNDTIKAVLYLWGKVGN